LLANQLLTQQEISERDQIVSTPRHLFVTFWTCQKVDIGRICEFSQQAPEPTLYRIARTTLQHFC
jgi:hypothetical protein